MSGGGTENLIGLFNKNTNEYKSSGVVKLLKLTSHGFVGVLIITNIVEIFMLFFFPLIFDREHRLTTAIISFVLAMVIVGVYVLLMEWAAKKYYKAEREYFKNNATKTVTIRGYFKPLDDATELNNYITYDSKDKYNNYLKDLKSQSIDNL